MAMIPLVERPDPDKLAALLAEATSAVVLGDDARRTTVRGAALAELRAVLRIRAGAPEIAWAPEAKVHVELRRHHRVTATVEVRGDLSIRLLSWGEAGEAESREALARWLAEHGAEGPSRALARERALPEAREAWKEAAPPELRFYAEMIADDPAAARDPVRLGAAVQAVRAARGGLDEAAWAFAAWYGAREGAWRDGWSFEAVGASALRGLGVHDLLEAASEGVPEAARRGMARFFCEEITSRGWAIERRLPEAVRAALFEASRGHPDDEARARRLFLGEGELAPRGSTLVAASATARFQRLASDGARAVAVDGSDLVKLELGAGASRLTKLFTPSTPLALRDGEALVLQPSGVMRVRLDDGEARSGRGPLLDLPRRRLPGMLDAYARDRDAALARAVASGAEVLPLEADDDACAAYEAFGGSKPAALDSRSFWGADVVARVLHEVPNKGAPRALALAGEPRWLGATATGVIVAVACDADHTRLLAVDAGSAPRSLGEIEAPADRLRSARIVGDRAWVCLAAPLGDVLVAVDPAG